MKKKILFIAALLYTLILFAGGGKGSKPGPGIGSEKTECKKIYKRVKDFQLYSVKLTYDLNSKFDSQSLTALAPDLMELREAHWEVISNSGHISQLSTILEPYSKYQDDSKPQVKADFSGVDCSGSISVQYKNKEDVLGNKIRNVPDFGVNLQSINFSIKTIKTREHNLQLIWEAKLTGLHDVVIDSKTKNISYSIPGVVGSNTHSGEVAVRRRTGGNSYNSGSNSTENRTGQRRIVSNTVHRSGGGSHRRTTRSEIQERVSEFELIPLLREERELIFSKNLTKGIYSGGVIRDDLHWARPVAYGIKVIE